MDRTHKFSPAEIILFWELRNSRFKEGFHYAVVKEIVPILNLGNVFLSQDCDKIILSNLKRLIEDYEEYLADINPSLKETTKARKLLIKISKLSTIKQKSKSQSTKGNKKGVSHKSVEDLF